MSGSLRDAWAYMWTEVWEPLSAQESAPRELFMELYPEIARAFRPRVAPEVFNTADPNAPTPFTLEASEYYTLANDPELARERFSQLSGGDFDSDRKLVHFCVDAYDVIQDYGDEQFAAAYVDLLTSFLRRYNLRYKVLIPFQIVPEVAALFETLIREVAAQSSANDHLSQLNSHFERAFDVLARDGSIADVHKCIGNACNYVEGLAGAVPGMRPGSLGDLAKQIDVWPHATVREALLRLYGFCSDYPAIRHAGNPNGRLRELELRDALVIPMLLVAFSGYFVDVDVSEILCIRTKNAPEQFPYPAGGMAAVLA
jgi:hypothetical protein